MSGAFFIMGMNSILVALGAQLNISKHKRGHRRAVNSEKIFINLKTHTLQTTTTKTNASVSRGTLKRDGPGWSSLTGHMDFCNERALNVK